MPVCANCGANHDLPFGCSYCGRSHCAECRLPENHACSGTKALNADANPRVSSSGRLGMSSTRRAVILGLGGATVGYLGYALGSGEAPGLPESVGSSIGNVTGAPTTEPSGQRRFRLNRAGYEYAEWTDGGDLLINFTDQPPMDQWYLIGPEPERQVLASGQPPQFGGSETVSLEYPIQPGEYILTGATVRLDPDNVLAADSERTGNARLDVTPELALLDVSPHGDGSGRAKLTLKNVGSSPYKTTGARFSADVPGSGTTNYEWFQDGEQLLIPDDGLVGVTSSRPFVVPGEGAVRVPDAYDVGVWAHGEPFAFAVRDGEIQQLEDVPDSMSG